MNDGRPRARRASRCVSGLRAALAVVAVLASACATPRAGGDVARRTTPVVDPDKVVIEPLRFDADGFAYVDGRDGRALTRAEVLERARATKVVLVAEQHDQASHHALQRALIAALAADGPSLVVGLEMLSWEKQEDLDRFNRGEIDEAGLAEAVDWQTTWGFDFDLYAPILETGRAHDARFVALNAPKALVRAVRKKGVEGLSAEERRLLPELDLGDDAHRSWFRGLFQSSGDDAGTAAHPQMTPESMDGFYAAQVTWDEAMAQTAVAALERGARQVVVLAGAGHVARGRGVPQRVERRRPDVRVLSILPLAPGTPSDVQDRLRRAVAFGEADVLVVVQSEAPLDL